MKKLITIVISAVLTLGVRAAAEEIEYLIRYNAEENTYTVDSNVQNLKLIILNSGTQFNGMTADLAPVFVRESANYSGNNSITVDLTGVPAGRYDFYYTNFSEADFTAITHTATDVSILDNCSSANELKGRIIANAAVLGVDVQKVTDKLCQILYNNYYLPNGSFSDMTDFTKKYNSTLFCSTDITDVDEFAQLIYFYESSTGISYNSFAAFSDTVQQAIYNTFKSYDFSLKTAIEGYNECCIVGNFSGAEKWSDIKTLVTQTYKNELGLDINSTGVVDKENVYKRMHGLQYYSISGIKQAFNNAVSEQLALEGKGVNGNSSGGGGGDAGAGATVDILPSKTENVIFSDLEKVQWASDSINTLAKKNIISGYGDGNFRPNNNVTRAEFATMVARAYSLSGEGGSKFQDVSEKDWFYTYVIAVADNGIIFGNEGLFNPNDDITRQDAASIIYRLFPNQMPMYEKSYTDDVEISKYAREAVYVLSDTNVLSGVGDGSFRPKETVTRAQAAVMICNALKVGGNI